MKLLNKFKQKESSSSLPDTRALKRGEIRGILLDLAKTTIPDFEFLDYRQGFYTFRRQRTFRKYKVNELFHVGFSLKGGVFSCSVASRLNPELVFNNGYNVGLINPHADLVSVKMGTGIIPYEEAYYFHDGSLEVCMRCASEVFSDIKDYGIRFLDKQFRSLNENKTIRVGFDFIEELNSKALNELASIVVSEKVNRLEMENSTYMRLKKTLQAVPGESREFRKRLPNTAVELIDLALAMNKIHIAKGISNTSRPR
ncbi:MAG: hypothetical protein KF762_15410 [Acidobacteria bacterium]|nr:hypothetical protein [Acidobacteriota bacterium]